MRPIRDAVVTNKNKMSADTLDLTIDQGSTWTHAFIVNQPAPIGTPVESLVPADLTGYTARMQVRKHVESPLVLLELTTSNGRITITPLTGRIDLVVASTTTAGLNFTTAVYDIEIVSSGGIVTRLARGKITLIPEVTR